MLPVGCINHGARCGMLVLTGQGCCTGPSLLCRDGGGVGDCGKRQGRGGGGSRTPGCRARQAGRARWPRTQRPRRRPAGRPWRPRAQQGPRQGRRTCRLAHRPRRARRGRRRRACCASRPVRCGRWQRSSFGACGPSSAQGRHGHGARQRRPRPRRWQGPGQRRARRGSARPPSRGSQWASQPRSAGFCRQLHPSRGQPNHSQPVLQAATHCPAAPQRQHCRRGGSGSSGAASSCACTLARFSRRTRPGWPRRR